MSHYAMNHEDNCALMCGEWANSKNKIAAAAYDAMVSWAETGTTKSVTKQGGITKHYIYCNICGGAAVVKQEKVDMYYADTSYYSQTQHKQKQYAEAQKHYEDTQNALYMSLKAKKKKIKLQKKMDYKMQKKLLSEPKKD